MNLRKMKKFKSITKKILKLNFVHTSVALCMFLYIKLVEKTTRWEYIGVEKIPNDDKVIFAIWHNRILFADKMWPKDKPMNFIVSPSKDGKLLNKFLKLMNHNALVGSSGSSTAITPFKNAMKLLKSGGNFALAPDGSRGPRYHMKPGVEFLVIKQSAPVIIASYNTKYRIVTNGWDKMIVPLPFNKGVILYDCIYPDDIKYLKDCSLSKFLEKKLTSISIKSDKYFNHHPIKRAK